MIANRQEHQRLMIMLGEALGALDRMEELYLVDSNYKSPVPVLISVFKSGLFAASQWAIIKDAEIELAERDE